MDGKQSSIGKDEHAHINPAYLHEEGRSSGGPDTRSSTSVSSRGSARSSMKILTTKLKGQGRTRWLALAVVILVAIVLIIAITLAVYFTTSTPEVRTLKQAQTGEDTGMTDATTTSTKSTTTTRRTTRYVTTRHPPTTKVVTSTPYTTTTPVVEDLTVPSSLSVAFSDVLYSPTDTTYLTLICVARHSGAWNSLTIRRQFRDSYEPVAVITNQTTGSDVYTVDAHVFYPNMTHYKIVFNYEVTLSVTFEVFGCQDLTNFTCALDTEEGIITETAKVSIFMPEPEIHLPHAIVESRNMTLSCNIEVWGHGASSLAWKIKPRDTTDFMDFSVIPNVVETNHTCTKMINSTIALSPTMFENGSLFRCELETGWNNPQVIQATVSEATLHVIPSDYCSDKREFTIHPHPHGPCTLVIYCLNIGPLVYEIECDKGYCYDSQRTACVKHTAT